MGKKEIGSRLHVSVKTVGPHMENIRRKLYLKNAHDLMKASIEWASKLE